MKRLASALAFLLAAAAYLAAEGASRLEADSNAKARVEINIDLPRGGSNPGGPFGLGIILGEPSGLSAKLWFDRVHASDAGAAWSFATQSFAFHADYLYHLRGAVMAGGADIPPFAGIGGYLRLNRSGYVDPRGRDLEPDPVEFGVRVPLGICHRFEAVPIGVSLEIVPGLELFPATFFKLQGGIAVRYYF